MKKHTVHNKLVRDRIPEIIEASGRTCITEVLPNDAYMLVSMPLRSRADTAAPMWTVGIISSPCLS